MEKLDNTGNNSVSRQIQRWSEVQSFQIPTLFERYFSRTSFSISVNSPGENNRLSGIAFGSVGSEFAELLRGEDNEVAMMLGVFEYDNQETEGNTLSPSFNIFFRFSASTQDSDPQYYGITNPATLNGSSGFQYGGEEALEYSGGPVVSRLGIQPVVRNHLVVNWLMGSLIDSTLIFFSVDSSDSARSNDFNGPNTGRLQGGSSIPFKSKLVKSMHFPIVDYNRQVLSGVINADSQLFVHFGVVPSDFYFNEPAFSPIIEVRNVVSAFSTPAIAASSDARVGEDFRVSLIFSDNIEVSAIAQRLEEGVIVLPNDYVVNVQVQGVDMKIGFKAENTSDGTVSISSVTLDEQNRSTFVEFVQACPPFCGGGDG